MEPPVQTTPSRQSDTSPSAPLQAVGRSSHPVFHPFPRPQSSSPELDALEVAWWNEHGELIEKIWGLPKEVCEALRRPYVKRTSELMKASGRPGPIIELGCGTGWFGRMLADHGHQVIGLDNSSTQIQLAKELAAQEGKGACCAYECSEGLGALQHIGKIQGLVIHCFLHHLYWDELKGLFDALRAALEPDTPVMVVEPVYLRPFAPPTDVARNGIGVEIAEAQMHIGQIRDALHKQNALDTVTEAKIQAVISESARCGYFFSPKEVPFFDWELRDFLSKYGMIQEEMICGVTDLEVAQILGLVTNQSLRSQLASSLIPEFQKIDRQLLAKSDLPLALTDRYVFKCFWTRLR